jgi:hypothetical protein
MNDQTTRQWLIDMHTKANAKWALAVMRGGDTTERDVLASLIAELRRAIEKL